MEKVKYVLKENEIFLDRECPLDNTPLIQTRDISGKVNCPVCGIRYQDLSPSGLRQQMNYEINFARQRLEKMKEEEESRLLRFLNFVDTQSQP